MRKNRLRRSLLTLAKSQTAQITNKDRLRSLEIKQMVTSVIVIKQPERQNNA